MSRKRITPAEFIEILKAANAQELAEIRQLLGVPTFWPQPMPYPVPMPAVEPQPFTPLSPYVCDDIRIICSGTYQQ